MVHSSWRLAAENSLTKDARALLFSKRMKSNIDRSGGKTQGFALATSLKCAFLPTNRGEYRGVDRPPKT